MAPSFISRALIGSCPPATAPLQGLRVLTCIVVIIGHAYFFRGAVLDSPLDHIRLIRSTKLGYLLYKLSNPFTMASIDVFLFISGFLLASSLHSLSKRNEDSLKLSSAFQYLFARWLRLVPLYGVVALLYTIAKVPNCFNPIELLLLVRSDPRKNCVAIGWSTIADFQIQTFAVFLWTLTPSIVYVEPVLWITSLGLVAFRFVMWLAANKPMFPEYAMTHDYVSTVTDYLKQAEVFNITPAQFDPSLPVHRERFAANEKYIPWYYLPEYRGSTLLIGAAVWLSMHYNGKFTRVVRSNPVTSWMVGFGCVVYFYSGLPDLYRDPLAKSLFEAFGRFGLAISLAIFTILTCSVNGSGEAPTNWWLKIVRGVLGSRVFRTMARSAYGVYMIQMLTVLSIFGSWPALKPSILYSEMTFVAGLKWYLVTLIVVIPFCLFEELGLTLRSKILKVMFGDKTKQKIEPDSSRNGKEIKEE